MAGAVEAESRAALLAVRVTGLASLVASLALLSYGSLGHSSAARVGAVLGLAHEALCSMAYSLTAPRVRGWTRPLLLAGLTGAVLAAALASPRLAPIALAAFSAGSLGAHRAVVKVTGQDPLEDMVGPLLGRGPRGGLENGLQPRKNPPEERVPLGSLRPLRASARAGTPRRRPQ